MTDSQTAVAITCYGLGRTLPEAVDSVLAQTAPAQEIVIVDDGSTDALTLQVLAWLDAHEPRVRVIRAEHGGAAHARNVGIGATTAPFVVLLDGDDAFEPSYLEQASALLREREDLAFVCCALQAFGRASYRWKPPAYTVAEALGRGACGHISTVFRRELWSEGPGFDPSLPAYEDVDFWLGALRRGLRGAILDEALVRYRIRQGSRYHSAVVRDAYLPAKRMLIDKHLAASRTRGEDVLVTLLDFQRELAGHATHLREERERLEEALADAEGEIAEVRDELAEREIPALAWSRPPASDPGAVERHLSERMLRELTPDGIAPERTLRIGPGDPWPAPAAGKPAYDLVVVAGALERERDPQAALARCREALRPGGRLLVAAATMARAPGALRGYTEPSLRRLLCAAFPPGEVQIAGDGNLMTCLAAVAGAPLSALAPAELDAVDPEHPTVVAGSARVPAARGGLLRRGERGGARPRPPLGARADPPRRAAILCYHRVAALRPDVHGLCTPPERFAEQMELLAERYRPLPLAELGAQLAAGEVEPGAVAVTFDDGYLDNLDVASPLAAELGVPFTVFVSGAPAERPREAWWDTAQRVLLGEEPIPERLELELDGIPLIRATRSERERAAALHALHGRLLHAGPEGIEALIAALVEWSGLDLPPRRSHRLMTVEEVAELAGRPGHAVGAHGLHHLLLPSHEEAVQERELSGSKAALERIVGAPVELLAYPYGGCDVTTAALADELGFELACTVEGDAVHAGCDPLRLPRLEVRDESAEQLRVRLERTVGAAR